MVPLAGSRGEVQTRLVFITEGVSYVETKGRAEGRRVRHLAPSKANVSKIERWSFSRGRRCHGSTGGDGKGDDSTVYHSSSRSFMRHRANIKAEAEADEANYSNELRARRREGSGERRTGGGAQQHVLG